MTAMEKAPNSTKRLVPAVYYDMFTYRLMGLTYGQIAEKTGYSEGWVKHLFAKGGVLYDLWRKWLDTAKKNSIDEAVTMMFGHLPDIIRARIIHAKSMSAGAVESSKLIMGFTLGEGHLTDPGMASEEVDDGLSENILKAFSNFGILQNDTADSNNQNGERNNTEQETAP